MTRGRDALFALALVFALSACKRETASEADAGHGPAANEIRDDAAGVVIAIPPLWSTSHVPAIGEADAALRTIVDLRRTPPRDRRFVVAPRFVGTIERTTRDRASDAFRDAMSALRAVGDMPGVRVDRSASSARRVGNLDVAELEIAYTVGADGVPAKKVIQESLVVPRVGESGARFVVTLSATYLEEDAELVRGEVRALFDAAHFSPRPPFDVIPEAAGP